MPTRSKSSAESPKFLRVDKHLSKYTKQLNKYLEQPIQWSAPGKTHTKGLVLIDESSPAAEISVPNRIAQEHADRDAQIAPGSAAASLVGWWLSTLGAITGADEEPESSDKDGDAASADEGMSSAAKEKHLRQLACKKWQRAADHASLVLFNKAFEALKNNRIRERREKAEAHKNRLYLVEANLDKHEISRLGSRSLKLATAHARRSAAPRMARGLRRWCATAKELKENPESDDEDMEKLVTPSDSEDDEDSLTGLAAKLAATKKTPLKKPAHSLAPPATKPPALDKTKPNGARLKRAAVDPLERVLGEAGLSAFAPALREEGVTLQGLCESSLEEIEEVIEHPLRGKARIAFAKLLGVSAAPPAPPKTPSRKAPAPASTGAPGAPVPFVEGLEDCLECDACGAPGREFEVCETCGKIVTQRRLRPTPRLKRQESLEAGQPPDTRPSEIVQRGSSSSPAMAPPAERAPRCARPGCRNRVRWNSEAGAYMTYCSPICQTAPPSLDAGGHKLQVKELSGLPILSNAFGDLKTEEEVASVAQDWTEKLGKALSARTTKATGFGDGRGSLEVVLEELEMLCAVGVSEGFFKPEQLKPAEASARALRMHARGLAIQISAAPGGEKDSADKEKEKTREKAPEENLALQFLLNNDKSRKSGALDYESSIARLNTLQENPKAVEALAELAEDAKLDKPVAVKLAGLAAAHPEIPQALLGGGASVRLPAGTPCASLAASLVSIRDRLIQEVGLSATNDMPGGHDATVVAKAAFEGKLSEVEWKSFYLDNGEGNKNVSNEQKAALALKGMLPALEDLLAAVLVGDSTTESTLKQLRVRLQNAKAAGCSTAEQVKNVLLAFFEHHDKLWKSFLNGSAMPSFRKTWKTLSEDNANVKRFLARTEPGAADQGEIKRVRDLESKVTKLEEEKATLTKGLSECNKRVGRLEAMCKAGFEAAQVDPEVLKTAASSGGSGESGSRGSGGKGGGRGGGGKGAGKGSRGSGGGSNAATTTPSTA